MNTKNTYPPTYTSVSPTTSMSTRARRALGSVELENRAHSMRRPSPRIHRHSSSFRGPRSRSSNAFGERSSARERKDRARAPSRSRSMSAATEGGETGAASEALDRVVLRYLHRRGYSSAAGVLRMEAKIAEKVQKGETGVGGALASAMGADAAISDHLLFHTETEADPRALVDGYGALRDWAHNSLDLYKVRDARAREEEEREETMVGDALDRASRRDRGLVGWRTARRGRAR